MVRVVRDTYILIHITLYVHIWVYCYTIFTGLHIHGYYPTQVGVGTSTRMGDGRSGASSGPLQGPGPGGGTHGRAQQKAPPQGRGRAGGAGWAEAQGYSDHLAHEQGLAVEGTGEDRAHFR